MKYANPDCPYCGCPGSQIEVDEVSLGAPKPYACSCPGCGAIGPRARTAKLAASAWDRRVISLASLQSLVSQQRSRRT